MVYFTIMFDFTWSVSDWCRHLRKHLGTNATNYFMYQWVPQTLPTPPLTHQVQAAPASQPSRCTALHL